MKSNLSVFRKHCLKIRYHFERAGNNFTISLFYLFTFLLFYFFCCIYC
jgi:hypothetical protein